MRTEECNVNIKRVEDLYCIYNTIATFLQQQNFEKTCAIFRQECDSRGFLKEQHPDVNTIKVTSQDCYQEEEKDVHEDTTNVKSVDESVSQNSELASTAVTYYFQEEKTSETASICDSNIQYMRKIQSKVSVDDFLELKEKFLDLQEKHKKLMAELDEKTRYLDQFIPLLRVNATPDDVDRNNSDAVETLKDDFLTNSAATITGDQFDYTKSLDMDNEQIATNTKVQVENKKNITIPKNLESKNATKNEELINSFPSQELENRKENSDATIFVDEKDSVDSIAVTISDSNLNNYSEYSLLGIYNNEIMPKYRRNDLDLLFSKRKSNQVQSAPTKRENKERDLIGKDNLAQMICLSKPLSPKKRTAQDESFHTIDFERLKSDLSNGRDALQRSRILQALRWKLTKSSSSERSRIIDSYIENDLLRMQEQNFSKIYTDGSDDKLFEEALARLINTIASIKRGRDYLCSLNSLVKEYLAPGVNQMVEKNETISGTTVTFEMLVVTLQKLSIRKEQRKMMIESGLLQTISKLLSLRRDQLSSYCLEYSCALFMNLCLEDDAKVECCNDPKSIIKVFLCLLKGVQDIYMPYVSGALYSVLSEQVVRDEALRQQVDLVLFHLMRNTKDKYVRKQLEFIIRSRFRGEGANFTSNENGPVEEIDLLEPELDQKDTLTNEIGNDVLEVYKSKKSDLGDTATVKHTLKQGYDPPKRNSDSKVNVDHKNIHCQTPILKSRNDNKSSPQIGSLSKMKFDAEVATDDKFRSMTTEPLKSVIMYNHPFEEVQGEIDICNCVGPAKYDCGCYDAIKRSVENDDLATPRSNNNSSKEKRQYGRLSLFSGSSNINKSISNINSISETNQSGHNNHSQSMRKKS